MGHFLGTIATFIVEQRMQKTNPLSARKRHQQQDDMERKQSAKKRRASSPLVNDEASTANSMGLSTPVSDRTSMPSQVRVNGELRASIGLTPRQFNQLIRTPGGRQISQQMRQALVARRQRSDRADARLTGLFSKIVGIFCRNIIVKMKNGGS